MAYAELAALRPRAGGEYVYLYEAFGPLAAFLTGCTSFVAGFSGAIAASAVGLASYLGRFVPAAGDATPLFTIPLGVLSLRVSPQAIVALAAIAALSWVHIRGVGPGRLVQNAFAIIKVLLLLGFVALALSIGTGSAGHFAVGSPATAAGLLLAMIPVMFSYSGWNAAAYVAEEIRNPGRNVPIALGLGTGAVVLVYLALNMAYIYAMPVPELAGLEVRVIDAAADRLFGINAGDALALVTLFIVAGSISAMVFAGPRVYYAMARDGLFLPAAARVSHAVRPPMRGGRQPEGRRCEPQGATPCELQRGRASQEPRGAGDDGSAHPGNEQDGDGREPGQMMCDAAQEHLPEHPAPLAAHQHERRAAGPRPLEDDLRRDPVGDLGVDR